MPSATEISKNGIDVAEIDAALLRKIEKLTLYTIQQQKQIEMLMKQVEQLKEKLNSDEK